MKVAQELRSGNTIKIGNDVFMVLKSEFNKSGRNAAVMKLKMKNLLNGAITETVMKAADKVDDVRLDRKKTKFSYENGDTFVFLDQESWEEISLTKEDLGDATNYLEDEMELDVIFYEGTPVGAELANFVEKEVVYCEEGLRGDTTGRVTKPAQINTGYEVQVPIFVNQGDWIKIDTRTHEYVERIKK